MQIDYNQYIIELEREEKEAKAKFEASVPRVSSVPRARGANYKPWRSQERGQNHSAGSRDYFVFYQSILPP